MEVLKTQEAEILVRGLFAQAFYYAKPTEKALEPNPKGGTPYIQMIGIVVVFFRGCNR